MLMFKGEEVITGRRDGMESMFLDGHAQNQLYKYREGRRHERRFRLREHSGTVLKMNIQLSTGNLNQEGNGGEAGAAGWGGC